MLINSGNISFHLREHRVSFPTGNGITKTETEMKRETETETETETEYGIRERFQTIDLKKKIMAITIQ